MHHRHRRLEEVLAGRVTAFAREALNDLVGVALCVSANVEGADLIGDREVGLADQRDPLSDLVEARSTGRAYVNLHTNDGVDGVDTGAGDFPGGEIRADIR